MKKIYFIIILVLGFCSCQKEISHEIASPAEVDVYVAGYVFDGTNAFATYWKNGSLVSLTSGGGATSFAGANSIAVVGSDVYVAGGEGGVAKYWKNGSPVILNDGSKWGWSTSIAVSGNDVYVAGYLGNVPGNVPGDYNAHAVYWKNGNATYLPENTRSGDWADNYPISSTSSGANSIFISGSDIYIAGGEEITRMISPYPNLGVASAISAVYWKNGNEIYLIKGGYGGSLADDAYSIFVAEQDVYACGALEARYWKNGASVYLPGITTAKSIFVSEGDVYVAGTQPDGQPFQTYNGTRYRTVAKYWKNGNPVSLSDGTKDAYATSIAVSGTDIYVAGYEEKTAGAQDYIAKYWKNGNPVILGDVSKESETYSIVLAKK